MEPEGNNEKVKVAVRVRPFNRREIDLGGSCVVRQDDSQSTTLVHPSDDRAPKSFTFDHFFNSLDPRAAGFANQEEVFEQVGSGVLENAFAGYNACIFAYGQTGSGKSYSMMGTAEQPGVIPRLCNSIFQRIEETTNESQQYKVEVSYMEIYNEKVRDLLDPKNKRNLKVREHKILGPIVDGLSELAVSSYEQISQLIEEGNKSRTVAATNMNAESSRSHAVFIIRLTQTLTDVENSFSGEKVAKISLVDLAGSERAQKSGAVGKRLEEGGSINKSLSTLGMVISALAERTSKKEKFVPYRDSVLTWLLKDSLGGNSRTVMIATISPAADNYEETLSTLRYADRAKRIVNHAVVNEDPNARIIRELREEVETLRQQISQTKREHTETEELRERLAESERLVEQMNKSWEERLKETDTLYKERQRDLTEIGISVESSGIKVEKNRFYLVNLNADPSLNELLVYYVNGTAVIGNGETKDGVDILLQGFCIQQRHAKLEVIDEPDMQRLYITPLSPEAKVCVNGREIAERVLLRNGFRLLIGFNHYFRVNCPRENDAMAASMMDESALFGYDDAWNEANTDASLNPMTSAVDQYMEQLAIRHQEDKQAALEQQYEAFEKYIHGLAAGGFTPSTPMTPGFGLATPMGGTPGSHLPPHPFPTMPRASVRSRFLNWAHKRDEQFAESLSRLKEEIVRSHALVKEANLISSTLNNGRPKINYDVTLQIPAANLRPSRIKTGAFVCEPVIVVRRQGMSGCQLWTVEQLENKLVEMRDAFEERKNGGGAKTLTPDDSPLRQLPNGFEKLPDGTAMIDPFFESHENHSLIGVANVFLEVLFHDIKLDYQVPIISQQGEVVGRLHVEVQRVFHSDGERLPERNRIEYLLGKTITCRLRIKRASALPQSLSHFVFCQYSFFNLTEMLVVASNIDDIGATPPFSIQFDHEREFSVVVSDEFLEYVQEDALSIEIWGHRSSGFEDHHVPNGVNKEEKLLTLQERWAEVSRRLKLSVQMAELNDEGRWACVEVERAKDVATGGVFQLKQGQQRRVRVAVASTTVGGSLPLVVDSLSSVAIGCINVRSAGNQKPLDSYQEEDLERIRSEWTAALETRQKHLEEQINGMPQRSSQCESDREYSLMEQWVALTEERTALSLPATNSGIPGAPSDWTPPPGVENHVPVIFLNLNADELAAGEDGAFADESGLLRTAGAHALLPKESAALPFIYLPVVEQAENEAAVTCSWDSSLHDDPALNLPTGANERVYAIVKVTVRLSHPCEMDLVLRKRICLHIYKKPSIADRIFKTISRSDPLLSTTVHYDIVAHLPKSSHEVEDRSSLAMMAARQTVSGTGEEAERLSYVEEYAKSIQAVESMLKLDRLRQEVAVSSLLSRKERKDRLAHLNLAPHRMKRATSLPNAMAVTPSSCVNPLEGTSTTHDAVPRSLDTSMSSSSDSSSLARPTFLNLRFNPAERAFALVSPMNEKQLAGIDEEPRDPPVRSSTVPEALSHDLNANPTINDSVSLSSSSRSSSNDENSLEIPSTATDTKSMPEALFPLTSVRKGGPLDLNISAL